MASSRGVYLQNNNQNAFLRKHQHLNSWNKYKNQARENYFIYHPSYNTLAQSGPIPTHYTNDSLLASEVLSKAGPYPIYQDPNYQSYEIGGVRKVISDAQIQANGQVNYKINQDAAPIRIVRPSNDEYQQQNISVRYLRPPTPERPGPIVIQERQLPQPPAAPPILIRQVEPRQPTPPPLLVREQPPTPPPRVPPTFIEKILPAHPPPPRQVIVEKIPAKPPKPQTIIYEKWLPYKNPGERQVIVEKAPYQKPATPPRNVIIEYERPRAIINKQVVDEGVYRADPKHYQSIPSVHQLYNSSGQHGSIQYVDQIVGDEYFPVEYLTKHRPGSSASVFYSTVPQQDQQPQQRPQQQQPRPPSAPYGQHILVEEVVQRPKTSFAAPYQHRRIGPVMYNGPWSTTYKTSYYDRGFDRGFQY